MFEKYNLDYVIESELPLPEKITKKTKGYFERKKFTSEEYEERRKRILETPLPGEEY